MDRSILRYAAVVLFVLAAVFLFGVKSIGVEVDLGLISCGLAAWAVS